MNGVFLQSSEWERIHQQMGRKTWRVAGVLIVRHNLPRNVNYLYCARPEFKGIALEKFLKEARVIAVKEKSLFLKIDPVEPIELKNMNVRSKESQPLQPRQTVVINLSPTEEELMAVMHEKTRYNIRLAERKGVEVAQVIRREAKDDFEIFWKLLSETGVRQGFHLHERKHYELLAAVRTQQTSNELFFARMQDNHDMVLAGAMINFYRDPHTGITCATYLHGASSREHREYMAPYLLHWRIMQAAKARAVVAYDQWGIDEKRWPGVTRFKNGFGGSRVEYPMSVHIIYRPVWSMIYRLMKKWRG